MRWVFLVLNPMLAGVDLTRDSHFHAATDKARGLAKLGEDVAFFVPRGEEYIYPEAMLEGVRKIEWDPPAKSISMVFERETLMALEREVFSGPVDVIVSTSPVMTPYLEAYFGQISYRSARVPVVGNLRVPPMIVSMPLYDYAETHVSMNLVREVVGQLAGYSVFNSGYSYDLFAEIARSLLKPSVVTKMMSKLKVASLAVDTDVLKFGPPPAEGEPLRLSFFGVWDERKRPELVLSIYDKVYKAGGDVEIRMFAGGADDETINGIRTRYPHVHAEDAISYGRYVEELSRTHAFVCASTLESFGLVNYELLYSGAVGVYIWSPNWMTKLLPPKYPFVANNEDEATQLLFWIAKNYDQAREMVAPTRQWIAENLSVVGSAKRLLDAVRGFQDEHWESYGKKLRGSVAWSLLNEAGFGDEVEWEQAKAAVEAKYPGTIRNGAERAVHGCLYLMGYREVQNGVYRKVGDAA